MNATTEMEIKITGGRIIGADVSADGVCKLTVEVEAEQKPEEVPSKTPDEITMNKLEEMLKETVHSCRSLYGYGGEVWDPMICGDD